MSYRTIEQITSRGYEKVASFLTQLQFFGTALGVLVGAGLMTVIHHAILSTTLLVLLAALGYLLTTEMDGMAPYERLVWRLRGLTRGALQGRVITPDDLPGVVVNTYNVPISWDGSIVQLASDPTLETPTTPTLARPRSTSGTASTVSPVSTKEPHHAAV